jgi:hypothetical protein
MSAARSAPAVTSVMTMVNAVALAAKINDPVELIGEPDPATPARRSPGRT